MNRVEDIDVIDAMRRYGGSFVKALGEAAYRADGTNLAKIRSAFHEYWSEYTEVARVRRAAEAKPK